MVNGINSVVNFKELQEKREVPDEVLSTQGASAIEQAKSSYISKYNRSVKWCYRRNIGTHRFWIISIIKKITRFCFRFTHYRLEFVCRGRGKRPQGCRQDLPLHLAKKAAVYVSIIRR